MTTAESTSAPDAGPGSSDRPDSGSAAAPALVADSQRFLRAVRTPDDRGPALDAVRTRIADASPDRLTELGPDERLAFWLNVYNAATGPRCSRTRTASRTAAGSSARRSSPSPGPT